MPRYSISCFRSPVARFRFPVPFLLALIAPTFADTGPCFGDTGPRPGSPTIDWQRGLLLSRAGAAADLRTPSAEVARVGSERRARAAARAALARAAADLPLAAGGTVGAAVTRDAAARARLDHAVDRALDVAVDWSTDGSVMITAGLPLEAVRLAVAGAPPPPATDDAAPTALIVDARAAGLRPALGLTLAAGGERYTGPTIFHTDPAAAAADLRAGARPRNCAASRVSTGMVTVDLDPPALAAARRSGALIVILVPPERR